MADFLQHYKLKIHTLSPVFIGSGRKIGKKEFVFERESRKVLVMDMAQFYQGLLAKGIASVYEDFMLGENSDDAIAEALPKNLSQWLSRNGIGSNEYRQWGKYELDAGDALQALAGKNRTHEVAEFIRDAHGCPYVPGSSVKGMLRTALLAYEIKQNGGAYKEPGEDIKRAASKRKYKNRYLSVEAKQLENIAFHTLKRLEKNKGNSVNSTLAGLIIGDSMPLENGDLTLCQKIDYSLERQEHGLPILRECIKPDTEIWFDLTIDRSVCPYTKEDICQALADFQNTCNELFYNRFGRAVEEEGAVWLGGGAGYLSKTVLYPLLGAEAYQTADVIFRNTLTPKEYEQHKHFRTRQKKLAPHVCKCTRYKGKLYNMGVGKITFVE